MHVKKDSERVGSRQGGFVSSDAFEYRASEKLARERDSHSENSKDLANYKFDMQQWYCVCYMNSTNTVVNW